MREAAGSARLELQIVLGLVVAACGTTNFSKDPGQELDAGAGGPDASSTVDGSTPGDDGGKGDGGPTVRWCETQTGAKLCSDFDQKNAVLPLEWDSFDPTGSGSLMRLAESGSSAPKRLEIAVDDANPKARLKKVLSFGSAQPFKVTVAFDFRAEAYSATKSCHLVALNPAGLNGAYFAYSKLNEDGRLGVSSQIGNSPDLAKMLVTGRWYRVTTTFERGSFGADADGGTLNMSATLKLEENGVLVEQSASYYFYVPDFTQADLLVGASLSSVPAGPYTLSFDNVRVDY